MVRFSAVCLICEDIREEKSGQDTIVGLFPDNLNIERASLPTGERAVLPEGTIITLPRLAFYIRVHFSIESARPKAVFSRVVSNEGTVIINGEWTSEILNKAFDDAARAQMPFVGLVFKLVAARIPVALPGGKITAVVTVDGVDQVAGAVNIIFASASEQPTSQSQPAV
jgi:hypothetical protein